MPRMGGISTLTLLEWQGKLSGLSGSWCPGQSTSVPMERNGSGAHRGLVLLARVPPGVGALPGTLVLLGEGVEDLVKILRLGGPRQLSKQNVIGADVLTIKPSRHEQHFFTKRGSFFGATRSMCTHTQASVYFLMCTLTCAWSTSYIQLPNPLPRSPLEATTANILM